jgi:hypothetical protein
MIPQPIQQGVRQLPVGEKDLIEVVNRETVPVLRATRNALNALLTHLAGGEEPELTDGSVALAETAGVVIVTQPGVTLTLPAASARSESGGQRLTVRNRYSSGAGDTTLVPSGLDTVEGGAIFLLAGDGAYVTIVSSSSVAGAEADTWDVIG